MLHEARSMVGERHLLDMANTNKYSSSGSSHKKLDQQVTFVSLLNHFVVGVGYALN